MKKSKIQLNTELAEGLHKSLNGLNEKYAQKLQKTVLHIVKKMSKTYADLLAKELHAGAEELLIVEKIQVAVRPAPAAKKSRRAA